MQRKTRVKRLSMLKDMLDRHDELFPKAKFDINEWLCVDGQWEPENEDKTLACLMKEGFCATAACALGSAALYKPFNKMGLKVLKNVPTFNGEIGFEAGEDFFGISYEESNFLFNPSSYDKDNSLNDYTKNGVYNLHNIEPKVSGAKHVRGKVKPKHVSERVKFLIDWYSANNHPAFGFNY